MSRLEQLEAFLEVAACQSFVAAARKLGLPRSTISARVQALEDRLQVRLLQRTTRRVVLTDEGRRYRDDCAAAFEQLSAAEAGLSRPQALGGRVRLTVPVDMPAAALATIVADFVDRHPAVRIEVIATDQVLDLLADNVDLALRGGAPGTPGLVARKIGEGRLAFHASPEYARRLPGGRLTDLAGHVVFDPARRLRHRAASRAPIETGSFALARALAAQSRGIALLPEGLCEADVMAGTLVRLAHDGELPTMPLYLVMPSRRHVPARVRAFIDHLTASGERSLV